MKHSVNTARTLLVLSLLAFVIPGQGMAQPLREHSGREAWAQRFKQSLEQDLLDKWYPTVVDTKYGGYLSNLTVDFEPMEQQPKMIVTQARHVWTLSAVADMFPGYKKRYQEYAAGGVEFLKNKMWDQQHGGFYSLVTREGKPIKGDNSFTGSKTSYGNAFAIYGLVEYAQTFNNEEALQLAKRTFRWMDEHAHDPEYGGYFQNISREGRPMKSGWGEEPPKDQNSSIHIMEAFAELYRAWPNDTLRSRLQEMLTLVRDTIRTDQNHLQLFFKADWTPISYRDTTQTPRFYRLDHVSFGHDVETAYLMLDATEALGLDTGSILAIGKKMVDRSIEQGWDSKKGGFYDAGYYLDDPQNMKIVKETKQWWISAEALNSFLIMGDLYPDDSHDYYGHFKQQWDYIDTYVIDQRYGGWYRNGIDTAPWEKERPKGDIWKGTYHNSRALMNCIRRLRSDN